jgi:hypothetical protein
MWRDLSFVEATEAFGRPMRRPLRAFPFCSGLRLDRVALGVVSDDPRRKLSSPSPSP